MVSPPELRRAVVIEDDPDIRGLLVRVLAKQGFEVTEAGTGLTGRGGGPPQPAGPGHPGPEPAGPGRPGSLQAPPRIFRCLHRDADRPRRRTGQADGPGQRRRRIHQQTVQPARTAVPDQRPVPPPALRRGGHGVAERAAARHRSPAEPAAQGGHPGGGLRRRRRLPPLPQRGRGLLRLVPDPGRPAPDLRRCHGQGHGRRADRRHRPGRDALHRPPAGPGRGVRLRQQGHRHGPGFLQLVCHPVPRPPGRRVRHGQLCRRRPRAGAARPGRRAAHRLPSRRTARGCLGRVTSGRSPACDLAPGDSLVVVSDGVLDVFDSVEAFTAAVLAAAQARIPRSPPATPSWPWPRPRPPRTMSRWWWSAGCREGAAA